jgi:3'-phosphoadenosine 5'-phosphosulfate sulfotransferase (PAPS reductase)/FAD synthetase
MSGIEQIDSSAAAAVACIDSAVREHSLTAVYALFSGGHDSLSSTLVASQHESFVGAVHINTGIGVEQTRDFVRETCATNGWSLEEVKAPEGLYEELVLTRGGFPYGSQSHNAMLYYLKQKPLAAWFKGIKGVRVGFVTGIRRHESVRRMGAGISVPVRPDGRKVWISPILDWSSVDCGRLIAHRGLARNPVVDLLHRSGECLCGALAREREIHEIAAWFPEIAQRINALERECERRGIVASVWAGKSARRLDPGQQQLFAKADFAPLCTSCVAVSGEDA